MYKQEQVENFLRENWGEISTVDMSKKLNIELEELLNLTLSMDLKNIPTPDIKRRWSEIEDNFLIANENNLSIKQASNLLYRSRYATYQRVKFLQLEGMVGR